MAGRPGPARSIICLASTRSRPGMLRALVDLPTRPSGFDSLTMSTALQHLWAQYGWLIPTFGLSFGGALALEVFRRHPTIPRTLILASAYAGWAGSLEPEEVQERLRLSLLRADLPPGPFAESMISSMFASSASEEDVDRFAASLGAFQPAGLRAMARSSAEADLRDVLPRIDVPTLLLYGGDDVRAPLPVAQALHSAISGSRLVVMPGVGHVSSVEAPELFNRTVGDFLRTAE